MGEQAAKEPTMEEILASIRRIISEDGEPVGEAAGGETSIDPTMDGNTVIEDVFASEPAQAPQENDALEAMLDVDDLLGGDVDFSDAEAFEEVDLSVTTAEPEPVAVDTPSADMVDEDVLADIPDFGDQAADIAPTLAPQPTQQEADMAAAARYEDTVLTNDKTAESAAGSLGKLISSLDMGGDNTIEGLVRELLKPMIKDWLDDNLPAIVERKVEAEVQRIAKMVG